MFRLHTWPRLLATNHRDGEPGTAGKCCAGQTSSKETSSSSLTTSLLTVIPLLRKLQAAVGSQQGYSHMEHQPPGFLAEEELLVPYGLVQPLLICAVISDVLKQGRAMPLPLFPSSSSASTSRICRVYHTAKVLGLIQVCRLINICLIFFYVLDNKIMVSFARICIIA